MNENTDREILLAILRSEPVTAVTPESWHAVAQLAHKHRLEPLLFSRLQTLGLTGQLPPGLGQELQTQYLFTARQNMRMYRELGSLFERFQRENVPCISLKGAYLAERIYGNIAVRPMVDVDLLVKETDLARVQEIVIGMGFDGPEEVDEATDDREHLSYRIASRRLRIEFHWNLIHPSHYGIHVDVESLWERARPTLIADIPVHELSPEDLVLHLCIHATKHFFQVGGLRAICDLAETLRRFQGELDWDCLGLRARQWGAERCVYMNLRLAKELLNAQVPGNSLSAMAPHDLDPRYTLVAEEQLFLSEERDEKAWPPSSEFARFWATRGLVSKVGLLWHPFFPSRQVMATIYPAHPGSPRILLYYPVRLWDLSKHYTQVVWHLSRGDEQVRDRVDQRLLAEKLGAWLLPGKSSGDSSSAQLTGTVDAR